jgi:DNA polymerase IV (DinB-like DNA polymerase)
LEQASIDEAYIDCSRKIVSNLSISINDKNLSSSSSTTTTTTSTFDNIQPAVDVEEYAIKIKNSIREQCNGLKCSIGIAPTKSASKIASDFKKPDGLTVIYAEDLVTFLEPLEVDKISGIGIKTTHLLKEMGIETIGQLAKSNVQDLIDKFGKKNGVWIWQVANGKDNSPVTPREDNISLSTESTLEHPILDKKSILEYIMDELVDDLYNKINRKGYEFKTVGLKLVRSDFTIETRETTFTVYKNDKESIVSVISSLLERFHIEEKVGIAGDDAEITNLGRSYMPIRKIGLKLSNLSRINRKSSNNQKTLLDFM